MTERPAVLDELKKLVIAQKTASLPFEPPAPPLAALHEAVQAYDQLVSQAVILVLQGIPGEVSPASVQERRARAEQVLADLGEDPPREVEIYRRYIQRLDKMSTLALQANQDTP